MINLQSTEWVLIRRWADEEITASRDRLEGALGSEATAFERGKIAALRSMLGEFDPQKTPDVEDVNYG